MSDVRERAREWLISNHFWEVQGYDFGTEVANIIRDLLQALDTEREDTWKECVGICNKWPELPHYRAPMVDSIYRAACGDLAAAIEREMGGKG